MSKIGDLFVRLGLKKNDFDKGIKDAGGKLEGFVKALKTFGGVVGKVMSAAAAAITKFAADAIAMTQKWGDKWEEVTASISSAYQTFVRQLSSGDGWNNLFANMREAAKKARELQADLKEIFYLKLGSVPAIAKLEQEIAELNNTAKDTTKSEEERATALEQIKQKEEEIAGIKQKVATRERDNALESLKNATQLSEINLRRLTDISNQDEVKQARAYLKERSDLEKQIAKVSAHNERGGSSASINEARMALEALDASTSGAVKEVAAMLGSFDKASKELVQNFVDADTAVIQVETDLIKAQGKVDAMSNSLGGSRNSGSDDKDAARAAAILKRAEDSAKSEIQLLYEKYQTEKALLEQYGIDTYALTDEYFRNLRKIMEKGLDDAFKPLDDLEPIEVEPIEINWEEIDAAAEAGMQEIQKLYEQAQELANAFGQAVATGFSGACEELASQLMGLKDVNSGAVMQALLSPLADTAVKMGEIVLSAGVAAEALEKLMEVPALSIAAGAALIAIGAAAKAGLASLAKGGSATTSVATSGYTGGMGSGRVQDLQTELVVTVEGRLSGSDILLSGQRTLDNWSR